MLPSIGYASAAPPQAADRPSRGNAARTDSQSQGPSFNQVLASAASGRDAGSDAAAPDQPNAGKAQKDSGEIISAQTSSQPPVPKEPAFRQGTAKQPGAPPADREATAFPEIPASEPAANLATNQAPNPAANLATALAENLAASPAPNPAPNLASNLASNLATTLAPSLIPNPAANLVPNPAAAAGEGRPDQAVSTAISTAVSTGLKRPAGSEKPVADPLAALAAVSGAAPLDPSSLAMLLGAGAARAANPVAASAAPVNAVQSHTGNEAQPVTGLTPQAQENAATPGTGLAFALRLSRETPVAPAGDAPAEADGAGASFSSFANQLEAAGGKASAEIITETKPRAGDEIGGGVPAGGPAILETAAAAAGNQPAEFLAKAANAPAVTAPELPSPPTEPVRAVRVELASDSNQRVALTLVERGGALSVSVRSADSNLARSLQEHLPDLSARLTEQRYQTEVWAPRVELPSASAGAGESGHHNSEFGGGKQSGQGGQSGQSGNSNPGQQQGRGERQAPDWFEELAAIGRTPQIRSEYLWVQ